MDACNIWLNGLVSSEYLLGARVEYRADENSETDLLAGIIHIHIYITPPTPMQECDFTLEYDVSYGNDYCETQKPPPCTVTVSSMKSHN